MKGNFTKREMETLTRILEDGEEVIAAGKQHWLNRFIAPAFALSTSKRFIIFKRDYLGVRTDMHVIPYENIVSFRLIHGFIFSTIKVRLSGSVKPDDYGIAGPEEDSTEIKGLTKADAHAIVAKLSEKISEAHKKKETIDKTMIKHFSPIINIFFTASSPSMPSMFLPSSFKIYKPPIVKNESRQSEPEAERQESAYEEVAEAHSKNTEASECAYKVEEKEEKGFSQIKQAEKEIVINEILRNTTTNSKQEVDEVQASAPKINPENIDIFKERAHRTANPLNFLKGFFLTKSNDKEPSDPLLDELEKKYL
ncbi:MAG: PH domain-containing protein [Candidatus Micrarchaeia archaeon]